MTSLTRADVVNPAVNNQEGRAVNKARQELAAKIADNLLDINNSAMCELSDENKIKYFHWKVKELIIVLRESVK